LKKNAKIAEWVNEVFPSIIEEATTVGAKIYFEDESGISLNMFSGRTWSIKGKTPVVYRSGQRVKRTMAAAISPEGDLYFETFEGGITAERYKSFLEHLNYQEGGITFVIHDGLPPHKSKLVQEYVESTKGKMRTFQLPGYSPELNPEEWVWERLKRELGKRAHKSIEELTGHAVDVMNKIKSNRKLIASYYTHVYST
jgi:transposase